MLLSSDTTTCAVQGRTVGKTIVQLTNRLLEELIEAHHKLKKKEEKKKKERQKDKI